ncbi:MAG: hypothetical protein ACREA8_01450 [Nitrosotalea sp.]
MTQKFCPECGEGWLLNPLKKNPEDKNNFRGWCSNCHLTWLLPLEELDE